MESCKTLHKYFEIFIFVDSGFSIFAFSKKNIIISLRNSNGNYLRQFLRGSCFFYFLFPSILSSFLYSVIKIFETNQLKKAHGRFTTMTKISMDVL